jgi:hypothetical protein
MKCVHEATGGKKKKDEVSNILYGDLFYLHVYWCGGDNSFRVIWFLLISFRVFVSLLFSILYQRSIGETDLNA